MLRKFDEDMRLFTHAVIGGREAGTEIFIEWGLTDLISFPAGMNDTENANIRRAQLEEKVAAMKKAAEQKK